ncbi:MAG: TIGR01777 family oxidoreductase [Actinomycetes bacterium]
MRWLLAGASGFMGTALRVRLAEQGHEVRRLVRRKPATATEFGWNPDAGTLDPAALAGVEAVVCLSGASVAPRPWTRRRRELLRSSRVQPNAALARALADLPEPQRPSVYISASGIAVYGTTSGSLPHTEDSPPASDFLAQAVVDWEAAARPAAEAGVRVVHLRTSPVLHRSGGAFAAMRLAWSAGLGAQLGDGRQRMPLVSLEDYLQVVGWVAGRAEATGPYNLTLSEPVTNGQFSRALARRLRRPCVLVAPAPLLRAALGELSEQLLGDMHVVPARLRTEGYRFVAPDVHSTIETALAPA